MNSMYITRYIALLILVFPLYTYGLTVENYLKDPHEEQRAQALFKKIRCQVCRSESIHDSDAMLAYDLRKIIRKKIKEGKSDKEVIRFITQRYGDAVLMATPFQPNTYLLWGAPILFFLLGVTVVLVYVKRKI